MLCRLSLQEGVEYLIAVQFTVQCDSDFVNALSLQLQRICRM